ncbi:MAG: hypothetical protein KZQ79_18495, partial [Candidatus Thiodiazotropha sp. (ex Lucinoma borealis)]|nr:hypothetical protein [Candidatus Thiodiazotropha sp. (ex Lucinoma borealis)]
MGGNDFHPIHAVALDFTLRSIRMMTKPRSGEAVNPQVTDVERRPGFLARDRLQELFDLILQSGYSILGPVVRDGAIQFSEITAVERLPHGVGNQQQPGRYRLQTGA